MPRKDESDPKNLKNLIPPVGEWRFLRDEHKTSRFNAGDRVTAEIWIDNGKWKWGVFDNRTGYAHTDTASSREDAKGQAEARAKTIKAREIPLPPDAPRPMTRNQKAGIVVGGALVLGAIAYALFGKK